MAERLTRKQVGQIVKKAWEKGERPDLRGANLKGANLKGANLKGAFLNGAFLNGAFLIGAFLIEANLSEANLLGAYLFDADLSGADLSGADLSGADLNWADLNEANLFRADLSEANLFGADLSEANLSEANLSEVTVAYTTFIKIDLSEAKGLDTMEHQGPSTIAIDTLQRSKGQIPEVFLRGCGLSDWEIEMAKLYRPNLASEEFTNITYKLHDLLVGRVIQYYSCFISYSHKDEEFARQLYDDLQESGVRCWFAPEKMKIGDEIRPTIDRSIRLHDKLLLILSKYSIESDWVETEVEAAFEKERKHKQLVLFPIRLDNTVMETEQAWAADIRRTRHIGDFRGWEDDEDDKAYQTALKRLLRDLEDKARSIAEAEEQS